MSAEKILGESWKLFRKHIRSLALVAAINFVIALAVGFAVLLFGLPPLLSLVSGMGHGNTLPGVGILVVFFMIVALVISPVILGAAAFAAKDILGRHAIEPLSSHRQAVAQYQAFFPVIALSGIGVILVLLGLLFFIAARISAVAIIFALLCLIPGMLALVLFFCSTYLVAAIGGGVKLVVSRAIQLGLKHVSTILLLFMVIGLGSSALSFVIGHIPHVGQLLALFMQSIVGVWTMLVVAVFYKQATA